MYVVHRHNMNFVLINFPVSFKICICKLSEHQLPSYDFPTRASLQSSTSGSLLKYSTRKLLPSQVNGLYSTHCPSDLCIPFLTVLEVTNRFHIPLNDDLKLFFWQTKGTSSFGKRHNKSHTFCRRCGRRSYHIQKSRCSSCGYPAKKKRRCESFFHFML